MKLLRSIPDILLRGTLAWDAATGAVWILVLGAIERIGPPVESDIGDFGVCVFLGSLGILTLVAHRQRPIAWIHPLGRGLHRLWRLVRGLGIQVGPDLRETPPIPRGVPLLFTTLLGITLGLAVLGFALSPILPGAMRGLAEDTSYLLALGLLFGFWSTLLCTGLLMMLLAFALVHDHLVRRDSGQRGRTRRPEFAIILVGTMVLLVESLLLPPWIPLVLVGLASAVPLGTLLLPGHPRLLLLHRRSDRREAPRSFDWRLGLGLEIATVGCLLIALQLFGQGQILRGSVAPRELTMPVTYLLTTAFAWVTSGAWCVVSGWYLNWARSARRQNPARPRLPRLLLPEVPEDRRRLIARALREEGFEALFDPRRRERADLEVSTFHPPANDPEARPELSWPPAYTEEQLFDFRTLESFRERHRIGCRRLLERGLSRLFKLAARRDFGSGEGFWVAPHLWFIVGLQRDSEEEEKDIEDGTLIEETIGPSYAQSFPLAVRHHFYTVMRALELDMIFVEDGVPFRRFKRVLRRLFELRDREELLPARDQDFVGIPGLRVIIQEVEPKATIDVADYPEPSYEVLGRAKVLHVFKDRGAEEAEVPIDFDWITEPAGAF